MFAAVGANTAERSHGLVVAIVVFNCLQLDLIHAFPFVLDSVWNFMLCRGDLCSQFLRGMIDPAVLS